MSRSAPLAVTALLAPPVVLALVATYVLVGMPMRQVAQVATEVAEAEAARLRDALAEAESAAAAAAVLRGQLEQATAERDVPSPHLFCM